MAEKIMNVHDMVQDMLHNVMGEIIEINDKNGHIFVMTDRGVYETTLDMVEKMVKESQEEAPKNDEEVYHRPNRYKVIDNYDVIDIASAVIDNNEMTGTEAICTMNGLKYWVRWKQKTPRASLKKAIEYAERMLQEIEAHPEKYPEG